jgi:hypothetical protein
MATKPMRKAFGRSLSDFPKLSKVEKKLVACCARGEMLVIGDGTRPDAPTLANKIRPGLIRFLMLGGDDESPVNEDGVNLVGAWIEDSLDLTACICQGRLLLANSNLNGHLILQNCTLLLLNLSGSAIKGMLADGAILLGGVFLRGGFRATGEVRLLGVQIKSNLECSDATFEHATGPALSFDHAVIAGSVLLNNNFEATGEVRLLGAQIGGNLACRNATFKPKDGDAISADRAVIKGSGLPQPSRA